MEERLEKLDFVFNPRSIAFIGATEGAAKWGFIILNNLLSGGYEGRIFPVNPGRDTVLGMRSYPSVRDIPEGIDLAVFTVRAKDVMGALDDCIARNVPAGVVVSAGFKELGGVNARIEAEMVRKARAAGMVLVGPNGQGICCPRNNLYPWMPLFYPPEGAVSFICQSGNILNMMIGEVLNAGFGVSKAVSSGNEADLATEDYYSYLAEDPDTGVMVSYIEGVEDGRRFLESARSATRRKPVVVLKGGRTPSGMAAAGTHTGAMASRDVLFEAACRQAGITLVRTIQEAGTTAAAFLNRPLPAGKRVGIVTGGGGLGVIAADVCTREGLEVVRLSEGTLSRIGELLPDWWSPGNPVDLVAGLDFSIVGPILETLMRSGEVDSVMLIFIGAPRTRETVDKVKSGRGVDLSEIWEAMTSQLAGYVSELYSLMREISIPIYVVSTWRGGGEGSGDGRRDEHTAMFPDVESACCAVRTMAEYGEYLRRERGTG